VYRTTIPMLAERPERHRRGHSLPFDVNTRR
jgi:hypothetical protein